MEKVSVLMCTYKEPINWIQASVESIINQTYSNLEVIIVVDAPDEKEIIDLLKKYEIEDERIHVYINEKNIGLHNSLNKGLKLCNGKYIARMDADDISHTDRIEKQIEYIKAKEYDLVGCDYKVFHDDVVERIGRGAYTHDVCEKILNYESCIAHPSWIVKKEVYDKLEGYRDIDSCEDYDFLIRALYHGFKMGNVPLVLLDYRNNPSSVTHLKGIKQQAITCFLSKNFRSNMIVTEKDLLEYLKSEKYFKFAKEEEKLISFQEKVNNSESIKKLFFLIILLTSPRFRYIKKLRLKVKWWKRNEKH